MSGIHTSPFPPHGVCWLWDWHLILLHAPADLLTFLAYSLISLTAIYVYRSGHMKGLSTIYPSLWWLGAAFIGTCGISHLGNAAEIWFGGWMYWLTGANKVIMSIASILFAVKFWHARETMSLFGRVLREVREQEQEQERKDAQ